MAAPTIASSIISSAEEGNKVYFRYIQVRNWLNINLDLHNIIAKSWIISNHELSNFNKPSLNQCIPNHEHPSLTNPKIPAKKQHTTEWIGTKGESQIGNRVVLQSGGHGSYHGSFCGVVVLVHRCHILRWVRPNLRAWHASVHYSDETQGCHPPVNL
jgi:hypothetical protein